MNEVARPTETITCPSCGCEFESERELQSHDARVHGVGEDPDYEPPEPDGECYRGNEAASALAEEQARVQRELK